MSQIAPLLTTLKREFKSRGITYRDAARQLGLSESSIKRLFSSSRLSLARLEQLCQLAGLELTDLVQEMAAGRRHLDRLTAEQEKEVAEDLQLLLVAICVLNRWTFEEIVATYRLSETDCVQKLARLDRLGLIELLPGNRIRLIVSGDFRWITNGPIQRFFQRRVQPAFMKSTFSGAGEKLLFQSGMLSRESNALLIRKMEKLLTDFNELHREDMARPLDERYGTSILIALRAWEFDAFRDLRRDSEKKKF